jgi:hypothetical protein
MKFPLAPLLTLVACSALSAQPANVAQVVAVQVSRLPASQFSPFEGELPGRANAFSLSVKNWTTGTALLLSVPNPSKAKIDSTRLLSLSDDTGKNLMKLPEGVSAEPMNDAKPATFVTSDSTGEVFVCVAARRAPAAKAGRVAGEIELTTIGGGENTKESLPIRPKEGTIIDLAPFRIAITSLKRVEASEEQPQGYTGAGMGPGMQMPPGAPITPGMPQPPGAPTGKPVNQSTPQSRPERPDATPRVRMTLAIQSIQENTTWKPVKFTSVDTITGQTTEFNLSDENSTVRNITMTLRKNNPLKFKITAVNAANQTTTRLKFFTSIGVSAED